MWDNLTGFDLFDLQALPEPQIPAAESAFPGPTRHGDCNDESNDQYRQFLHVSCFFLSHWSIPFRVLNTLTIRS
jgi:hypothetical protein